MKEYRENGMKETLRLEVGKELWCHLDQGSLSMSVHKKCLGRAFNITTLEVQFKIFMC